MELNAISRWNSISTDLYKANEIKKKRAAGELKPGQHLNIQIPLTGHQSKHNLFGSNNELNADDKQFHDNNSELLVGNKRVDDDYNNSSDSDTDNEHESNDTINDHTTDITRKPPGLSRGRFKLSEQIDQLKYSDGTHSSSSMTLEVLYRFIRRFVKGFSIGYIGKATLSIIGLLIKTRGNINKLRAPVARLIVGDPMYVYSELHDYIAAHL